MCMTTTIPMNNRLQARTVVGPLRNEFFPYPIDRCHMEVMTLVVLIGRWL